MSVQPLKDKNVVLGVTGSIAAFKAVGLASALVREGALVDVVMTRAAQEFIRPLSFQAITQRPVTTEMFSLLKETSIAHVSLARRADVIVVAPATANTIAKLSLGLCDDMIGATVLASTAPLIVIPAMDCDMYEAIPTQEHVARLRSRGVRILEPEMGRLASGAVGRGRMVEFPQIVEAIKSLVGRKGPLAGRKLVVTAGGTQEPLDPVRFMGNRSSGKMGYALAEVARDRGAQVTLITTPTALQPPYSAVVINVRTAAEMSEAVLDACKGANALIMSAAVADFRPADQSAQKIKKSGESLTVLLVPTGDILADLSAQRSEGKYPGLVVVGFAAETQALAENALSKLRRKQLDLMVANDVSGDVFGSDFNHVLIIDRDGARMELPRLTKLEVAGEILDRVERLMSTSD